MLSLVLLVGACGTPIDKEKGIATFKKEIKVLCDSSEYYFDRGFALLESGKDPVEVSDSIKIKIKELEHLLDQRSRAFQLEHDSLGLTLDEYNQVFVELKESMEPMVEKYENLKSKGVNLE